MPRTDPLSDAYWLSIRRAYEAARDPRVPLRAIPDYVEAAAFFGLRLGKSDDVVLDDCIAYSMFEQSRGGGRG